MKKELTKSMISKPFKFFYLLGAGVVLVASTFLSNDGKEGAGTGYGTLSIPKAYADTPTSCTTCQTGAECGGACADGGGDGSSGCTGGSDGTGCSCCFPKNTLIETPSGKLAISEIKEGDVVISYDEAKDEFLTSKVAKILRHNQAGGDAHDFKHSPLLRVSYDIDGATRELVVTANHPILKVGSNTYDPIGEFKPGDQLKTRDGVGIITSSEPLNEIEYLSDETDITVYNLQLTDGPHTFVADGVVVHNKDSSGACCW